MDSASFKLGVSFPLTLMKSEPDGAEIVCQHGKTSRQLVI